MRQTMPAVGRWAVAVAALALAGCNSGGGESGGGGSASPVPLPSPDPAVPGPGQVAISGRITYEFVPHAAGGGLDYGQSHARPARFVTVQFVDGSTVLAASETDADGNYSLVVAADRSGFIRARAESARPGMPGFSFLVRDNTDGGAIYALDGGVASSGSASSVRDLHAESGWTGTGYGAERAAAPFAILDSIHEAVDFLVAADPAIVLPALSIYWSPDNRPVFGADGDPDPAAGEIGTSFYSVNPLIGTNGIYLLGAENRDTDEYDPHVLLHEFAHYLERELARSDSIGGPHALVDRLDMRVAFSEGWATAFAALALDDPIYRDSSGFRQGGAFTFSAESAGANSARGWFSEQSVLELIYDLVDVGAETGDGLIYPFSEVWTAMTDSVATTPALTSIFPFYRAIKAARPNDAVLLDQLAAGQSIGPVTSDFGENETNGGGGSDVLPVYAGIAVGGGPVNVCSTDDFSSPVTGSTNKLASRRYLRFTPQAAGGVTITVRATSIPAGEFADPDFWVHRAGPRAYSEGAPSAACEDVSSSAWTPEACIESDTISLQPLEHVLEVYEWTNTNAADDEYPPIGRTCFDVTVTQP